MLESRAFRYVAYSACAFVLSEIVYHSFGWFKCAFRKTNVNPNEISEVIWTNELTQSCVSQHRRFSPTPNDTSDFGSGSGNVFGSCTGPGSGSDSSSPSGSVSGVVLGLGSNSAAGSPTMTQLNRIVKVPTPSKTHKYCGNPFCAAYNVGRLLNFIDSAKYSIDLAMYTFTSYDLAQAFNRALYRGVVIRIISDHEMAYSSGSQIIPLTKSGVPIRCNKNTMFMHHKFCILDSPLHTGTVSRKRKTPGIVLTGSLNWTMQGFGGNWENILVTSNSELVRNYAEEFERMWDAFGVAEDEQKKKQQEERKQRKTQTNRMEKMHRTDHREYRKNNLKEKDNRPT